VHPKQYIRLPFLRSRRAGRRVIARGGFRQPREKRHLGGGKLVEGLAEIDVGGGKSVGAQAQVNLMM
jgi:hypothetical protein